MTLIFAYILGVLVGIILGLIGGGGVFLFPINLFLLGQDIGPASAHAACLVGIAAVIGVVPRIRRGEVDWGTFLALGIPVSAGMLLVRLWLLAAIPDHLFSIGFFEVTRKTVVLIPFAGLLVLSFAAMRGLIGRDLKPQHELRERRPMLYYSILIIVGLAIGIIPAFAGAGGGVLIVPILVVLFGLPMKTVVGTSLAIVATKSAIGFLGGDLVTHLWFRGQGIGRGVTGELAAGIDFVFLAQFSVVMIIGAIVGSRLANRLDALRLKNFFAWLVLVLAIYILIKVIFFP